MGAPRPGTLSSAATGPPGGHRGGNASGRLMGGTSGGLGVSGGGFPLLPALGGRAAPAFGRLASGPMSKTAILAKLTAQPGKRDELVEALGPLVEAVDQEPGTELYVLHTSATEPDVVWFYELYTDQDS